MNNPSNNQRQLDPSNPARNNLPPDFFMRPSDRSDLTMLNKPGDKNDIDNFNDIFMNNFLRGQGPYPEFPFPGPNAQNLSFDPNLLYNFPGMNQSTKPGSTATQNDALNQNNLLFQNMNSNFLLPPNFGLGNPNLYDELLKNQNSNQLNQLDMPDKNIFENQGLIDNQFLLPGMDDFPGFKPQDVGQGSKPSSQANNMAGLGNFSNPMLLNNLPFGGDLGFGPFFFPSMPGLNIEDFYGMQMPGGVPNSSVPHGLGALPMDLKVENSQQPHTKPQPQQNTATKNPARNPQENPQANQRTEQKAVQNPHSNPQDLAYLNSMQAMKGMPGMSGLAGMPGMPGMQGMSGMPGKGMGNLGMFNFPQPPLGFGKDMDQANFLKYMAGGMDPTAAQEQPAKNGQQNSLTNPPVAKETQSAKDKGQTEESKTTIVDPMKSGLMNPNDLDILGKGMGILDPFMMNSSSMKNGKGVFDLGGIDDAGFMESHHLYNKMREKNRYERSLKIERYKNKKRNWQKKIAYDCRKRVADTRLRIKGRFISKKDSEKIQQLVGKQEEAFNEKKNLKLDYISTKFNIQNEGEDSVSGLSGKPSISKGYFMKQIDDILHNNKNPLPQKNVANNTFLSNIVRSKLSARSKKIFKIGSRREDNGNPFNGSINHLAMKQEIAKNPLKMKNEPFSEPSLPNMNQMNMTSMDNNMLVNRMKNSYFPEGFDLPSGPEMEHHPLLGNMNMLEAMAYSMGMGGMGMPNMPNMPNMGNMGMSMGMGLGSFDNRPELQQQDNEMPRYK